MNVCDNLGDHLVGNVYIKVREGGRRGAGGGWGAGYRIRGLEGGCSFCRTLSSALVQVSQI